jgi:hypothetical protein
MNITKGEKENPEDCPRNAERSETTLMLEFGSTA